MATFPQVVVGTYEEFVLGYKPQIDADEEGKCKLQQSFATHSHQASVRCIAVHGHLMASSGADEYINIYDMNAMEVLTVINYHNSTVTCLEFTPDGSHLISSNQNGDIAIFRCRDWNLVKLWKEAHKHSNGILSMSVHPSGSLLLTAGADNIVRFWNLIKGRQAYATNFSKKCSVGNSLNFGMWSHNGNFYIICIGNKIELYKTETAAITYEIHNNSKITCASFTKKNLLCIGTENGFIEIHSIFTKKLLIRLEAHKSRIKTMASFSINVEKNDKNKIENYLVSADSKGLIKLWNTKKKGLSCTIKQKSEVDCDCRITCLTVVFPKEVKKEMKNTSELLNTEEINDTLLVENTAKKTTSNEKTVGSNNLSAQIKIKSKFTKKLKNKNFNKTFSENNNKDKEIQELKNNVAEHKFKNKKKLKRRSFSETDFKEKKICNGIKNLKEFQKKNFSSSFSLEKKKLTAKGFGEWSTENV